MVFKCLNWCCSLCLTCLCYNSCLDEAQWNNCIIWCSYFPSFCDTRMKHYLLNILKSSRNSILDHETSTIFFFTLVLFHDSITAAHKKKTSTFSLRLKSLPVWNLIILFTFTVCYLLTNYRHEQTRSDQPFAPKLRLQSKSWPTACLISVGSLGVWVWKKTTPQHKHKLQRECLVLLGKNTVKRTTWDQNNILDGS